MAEMKISRHHHHLEGFKAIPDLFCSTATWPWFSQSCEERGYIDPFSDSGAGRSTSGFADSHFRCHLGSSES